MPFSEELLLEKEKSAQELEKNYKALVHNDRQQAKEIAIKLGNEYFEILKILNSKEKRDNETEIKIWSYLAQAMKFGNVDSADYFISFILTNQRNSVADATFTMLFNAFILSLDHVDSITFELQRPLYKEVFIKLRRLNNNVINKATDVLQEQFDFFEKSSDLTRREDILNFLLANKETKENGFKSFKYEIKPIFLLTKFCKERAFASQFCLLAYADFLEFTQKDLQSYLMSSQTLQQIYCDKIPAQPELIVPFWGNVIIYEKILQYSKCEQIDVNRICQLFDELDPSSKIPPSENLLQLMRKIVDSGDLNYFQQTLALIKTKTTVNIAENTGPELEKRFASFYDYYSQPVIQFHCISPPRLNEIEIEIMHLVETLKEKNSDGIIQYVRNITSSYWNNETVSLDFTTVLQKLDVLISMNFQFLQSMPTLKELEKQNYDTVQSKKLLQEFLEELLELQNLIPNIALTNKLLILVKEFCSDTKTIIKNFEDLLKASIEPTEKESKEGEEVTSPAFLK